MSAQGGSAAPVPHIENVAACPHCGRVVETFEHPTKGTLLLGHRVSDTEYPGRPNPWCEGGGRSA